MTTERTAKRKPPVKRITTTIERRWLAEIVDGTKTVEYRELKPYWTMRLRDVQKPFELRLINGMQENAPEVTVLITKVTTNRRTREYEFHIGKVLAHRNWNKRTRQPVASASSRQ